MNTAAELAAIEIELKRRRYAKDPEGWITDRLGEFIWSTQRKICRSVRDNRRTAVPSCHEAGKSYIASRIATWWIDAHPPGEAFVVTSAPTGRQVRAILWREINRAHAKGNLRGRTNQTEWWVRMSAGNEEMVAFGQKPADMDPAAFQGIHARYVLVIFDEACGIPTSLWDSADSLIANDDSRFLAIGNPDVPDSEFAEVCKPGSGWHVERIDAFETPNFTGEQIPEALRHLLIGKTWVEEKRRRWGESNPLWLAKIRGLFPDTSADGLIPMKWIKEAQERNLEAAGLCELGVDVGGGADRSVTAFRHGPVVRIRRRDQNPDTMQTCGNILFDLMDTKAALAKVDYIGIGRGVVDRAREQGKPVLGINVGKEAKDKEQFANLRAEAYWHLRDLFQSGDIDLDPEDDDLAAQLVDLKFKRSSNGKILIESKDEIRRRGKPSPDDADAVMLAFLPERLRGPRPVQEVEVMWG